MKHLVTYRPYKSMDLLKDFDSVFNSFFNDMGFTKRSLPSIDVREEEGKYILEADLPGLTEKDIDVKVEENLLSISSKKEEKKEEKKNGYLIKERHGMSFSRSFVLPEDVTKDKIEATFKNGVLSLTIPRAPKVEPKSIEVKKA